MTIGEDCIEENNFSFLQTTISLFQKDDPSLENLKWWILLDSQSATNIFCNRQFVKNVQKCNKSTNILTNGSGMKTDWIVDLTNYDSIWFHPDAITNIISLKNMCKKFRVTFDSKDGNRFIVHKPDGTKIIFKMCSEGLYYHDLQKKI